MVSEKLLVGLLTLGWKFLGFVFLGSRRQRIAAETMIGTVYRKPRRASYANGLIWMTALALIAIGVPLVDADPRFNTHIIQHALALLHVITQAFASNG
jgi:hypothetical protein